MSDHSPDTARELFEQLLELPEQEREARLQELTADDVALEARVRRLLEAHERAIGFDSIIPTPPDIALPDPEHIGPYRVLEKLGEGGMGVVYLGEQKKPVRRRVAIKIVRPGMASAEVINRFNAERQALALMSHPGISRILDAGATDNGLPYFVMEYVPGVPLISYCDEHRLNLRQRVSLVRHVCLAVQHAHQKGVIHRDLKPSNILVIEDDGKPVPKIIDFGIAKAMSQPLTDGTLHTRIGKLIGTPDYMSPEQCNSGSVDVDTRSDVYSLGVLLYQLLSSQLPYDFDRSNDSEVAILRRIVEEDPPPPSRRARDAAVEAAANRGLGDAYSLERRIRGELDWIVGRALERDRNRRYASAQELADDLERYLNNEALVAGPPSIGYRAGKFIRRHALGVSLMASIFLLVSGFAATLVWQLDQIRLERDRANREAEIARTVTEFTAGLFELASPSESGASDISARELLDLGVRQLDRDVTNESEEVTAALLEAAGNAYFGLGAYDEASRLFDAALGLHKHDSVGHARVILRSALTDHARGNTEQAEEKARTAVAIHESLTDSSHPGWVNAHAHLGYFLFRLRRLDAASEILEKAMAGHVGEQPTAEFAYATSILGRVRRSQGRLGEAESLLKRAIEMQGELNQPHSTLARDSMVMLGGLYSDRGEHSRALPVLRQVYESTAAVYGEVHTESAVMLNNLGRALARIEGKRDEAEQHLLRSLEINEMLNGPEHPITLIIRDNIAWLYRLQERWQESIAIDSDVLRIRRETLGDDHIETAYSKATLGVAFGETGQLDRAEQLLREALEVYLAQYGEDSWSTGIMYRELGKVLSLQGRNDEALSRLKSAHRILLDVYGEQHDDTIELRDMIAGLENDST